MGESYSKGFTLVGILISLALMAVVLLAIARMMDNTSKFKIRIARGNSLDQLMQKVGFVLDHEPACTADLVGRTFDSTSAMLKDQEIVDIVLHRPGTTDVLLGSDLMIVPGFKVESVSLKEIFLIGTDRYAAELVAIAKFSDGFTVSRKKVVEVLTETTTAPAKRITACTDRSTSEGGGVGVGPFCGLSAGTYQGNLGGYNGAKSKCVTACSSATAHICVGVEVLLQIQSGETFGLSNGQGAWIALGGHNESCRSWTANGSEEEGPSGASVRRGPGVVTARKANCFFSRPIACCD